MSAAVSIAASESIETSQRATNTEKSIRKCAAIHSYPYVWHIEQLLLCCEASEHNFTPQAIHVVSTCLELFSDSGIVQRCIKAFLDPINQIVFSTSSQDPRTLVVSSCNQIKIYDYESFRKKFEHARSNNESRISFIKMIPGDESGRLMSVLRNNVVCILSSSLKLIRHYDLLKERQKYAHRYPQKVEKLNYSKSEPDARQKSAKLKSNADKLIKTVTRDYSNGLVTDLSFSSDGSYLVVSFLDGFTMLCSRGMWDVRQLIKYPDGLGTRKCDFIPFLPADSHNGTTNKLLLTLTSNDELMVMSFVSFNAKTLDLMDNSLNYVLATNGRMLLNIQHSGEILVYNMEKCLKQTTFSTETVDVERNGKYESNYQWNVELGKIQTKVIFLFSFPIRYSHFFDSTSRILHPELTMLARRFFLFATFLSCTEMRILFERDNSRAFAIRSIFTIHQIGKNFLPVLGRREKITIIYFNA